MSLKRADGRFGVSLRALACETSHLERADGSAQFQHGQTLVMASVTGPVEAKPKQECADRAVVQVFVKTFDAAPSIYLMSCRHLADDSQVTPIRRWRWRFVRLWSRFYGSLCIHARASTSPFTSLTTTVRLWPRRSMPPCLRSSTRESRAKP